MSNRARWAALGSRAAGAWENRRRRLRGAICRWTRVETAGPGLHLGRGVSIVGGEHIKLGGHVSLGPLVGLNSERRDDGQQGKIVIGDRVGIGGGSVLSAAERVEIEDDVVIAPRVLIADHQHAFSDSDVPIALQGIDRIAPVRICRGAWIGVGATILQGVTIGENAVIGANAVVTRSVPPGAVAVGIPARIGR